MKWVYLVIPLIIGLVFTQAYAMGLHIEEHQHLQNCTNQTCTATMDMNQTMNKTMERIHEHNETHINVTNGTQRMVEEKHEWMHKEHYMGFHEKVKVGVETKFKFENAYEKWQHAKEECQTGNCSMYFNATQELVLTAINATIERLQTVNTTEAQELISELTNYYNQIENMTNITQLRTIYPEVRQTIAEANQVYAKATLIDLANTYMDYLNELPQNAEVEKIKAEINDLIANSTNMTAKDMAEQLKIIRGEILALG